MFHLIDMRGARGNNLLRMYCHGPRQHASACRPQIRLTNHRWLRQRYACANTIYREEECSTCHGIGRGAVVPVHGDGDVVRSGLLQSKVRAEHSSDNREREARAFAMADRRLVIPQYTVDMS